MVNVTKVRRSPLPGESILLLNSGDLLCTLSDCPCLIERAPLDSGHEHEQMVAVYPGVSRVAANGLHAA